MADDSDNKSLLPIVETFDNFPYDAASEAEYYKLYLPGSSEPHGYLHPATVAKMPWDSHFQIIHDPPRRVCILAPSSGPSPSATVNRALASVVDTCVSQRLFHVLDGQHSEPFAIPGAPYAVAVERFAAALFGITSRGASLTAYTTASPGGAVQDLWIATRAARLYSFPSALDTTVAGGVKAGATARDTLLAEAAEEASLPAGLVRARAVSAGVLTYVSATGGAAGWPGEKGLAVPDVVYVYDCELAGDVVPVPGDGEVEGFAKMGVREVRERLLRGEFKPDAAAVLIDFLMRHGVVTAENEENFVEISMRLHRRLPFRIAPPA
ncbi:hypothetical protein F4810DRAFT_162710 [Camillea tinctor]|nr:hypothetical protein F4810DRAFT_162710 [Camillea tinctor]